MSAPGPATVPAHGWRDIEVPPLGELEATTSVSIVLDGDPATAPATLEALRRQSYPGELVELLEPGASAAPGGDVIVVIESGVLPGERFVEAHARWHHVVGDAVSLGPLDPGAAAVDEPLGLVIDLTRDLTDFAGGNHLAGAEGTLAVRRALFEEAGGRGGAPPELFRLDLAHRLHTAGAVFVAEPLAEARGRPRGFATAVASACEAARTLELEMPEAAALLALPPFRPPASARRHARAAMVCNVEVGEAAPDEALATIGAALTGTFGDVEVRVQVAEDHPARDAIAAAVAGDARAAIAPSSLGGPCEVPFQATVPAVAWLDPRTLADLHELALAEDAGALHVTVPGVAPQDAMIEVVASGAWRRAERVAAAGGGPVPEVLGRLFGERWVSGVEVSTRRHGIEEPQVTEHGPLAAASDLDHERNAHLRFRDRADDMAERAGRLEQRAIAERLQARRERRAAERIEARLNR